MNLMTNREQALDALASADKIADDTRAGDWALIGIGHAILDVADAIRDAAQVTR